MMGPSLVHHWWMKNRFRLRRRRVVGDRHLLPERRTHPQGVRRPRGVDEGSEILVEKTSPSRGASYCRSMLALKGAKSAGRDERVVAFRADERRSGCRSLPGPEVINLHAIEFRGAVPENLQKRISGGNRARVVNEGAALFAGGSARRGREQCRSAFRVQRGERFPIGGNKEAEIREVLGVERHHVDRRDYRRQGDRRVAVIRLMVI